MFDAKMIGSLFVLVFSDGRTMVLPEHGEMSIEESSQALKDAWHSTRDQAAEADWLAITPEA